MFLSHLHRSGVPKNVIISCFSVRCKDSSSRVLSCTGTQVVCSTMIYRYALFCFLCFCLFLWIVPVVGGDTSGSVVVWNRPLKNLSWKYWNCISTKPLQIHREYNALETIKAWHVWLADLDVSVFLRLNT